MKITLILEGKERVILQGSPEEVLKEADEIIVKWKGDTNGEKEG